MNVNQAANSSENGTRVRVQLQMLWPQDRLNDRLPVQIPEGYELRTFQPQDAEAYLDLMHQAGFSDFNTDKLNEMLARVLPDGFFLIVHSGSGQIVATAMATHRPLALHPFGGELSWVAASRDHAGKGLGKAVCAAAVNRFLKAGYSRIYLITDDFRLAAIKIYLNLGFVPLMFAEDMPRRWEVIFDRLGCKRTD